MVKADMKQVEAFAERLKLYADKDFPRINGAALNRTAFAGMKQAQEIARKKFTLRNKWTLRTIQYRRVKGFDPKTQQSSTGSTAEYMEKQELGGIRRTKGGGNVAIAQKAARTSNSTQKTVKKAKYLSQLKLVTGTFKKRIKSRPARLVAGMVVAKQRKIAFKLKDNIYSVKSMSFSGMGDNRKVRVKLNRLYYVGHRTIRIRKRPWLKPTTDIIGPKMPRIYLSVAQKALNKTLSFLK